MSDEGPRDTGYSPERWEFDEEVTRVFDDMLRRSIPQYDVMRAAVFDVGNQYVKHRTSVLDLGCSRGEAMAPFVDRWGAYVHFIGVERSPAMLAAARERFKGLVDSKTVEIRDLDLRTSYPPAAASLTLCVLTLQFVPIEHRQRILANAWEHTVPGGAIVLVEKVLGSSPAGNDLLVRLYEDHKLARGYSQDEVARKRLALEGVLVPVTPEWNESLLRQAGFVSIECFWRWMNFAAWVAVKDPRTTSPTPSWVPARP